MRAHRVAIIGTKGFQRSDEMVEIECFSWKKVSRISNPSDYDGIIFNLSSLSDPATVDWDDFFDRFTVRTTLEVLANRGVIVIIGDPRFWPNEPIDLPGGNDGPGRQFLSWTGIHFDWDEKPGKTKIPVKTDPTKRPYLNYVEKMSRWNYCLKGCKWPPEHLRLLAHVLDKSETQFSSRFQLERICENRYGGLIVFAIKLTITEWIDFGLGDPRPGNMRDGRIIFLPAIDVPEEEMLAIVLPDILGIQVVVPEPSWASAVVAPGQSEIDEKIKQIKHSIAALTADLKNAEEERERTRRCVNILYKIGNELEVAVRDVLASLGAVVEPPTERGKEDGWLTVQVNGEILEGVLEIKGTRKDQFSLDGLRQLMEWVKRGKLNRKKKYKGIFVGNSGAEKEVSSREVPFVKDWTDTAVLDEIVVLLTSDLYTLYCLDCEGKLDRKQFWKMLFRKSGFLSLADLSLRKMTIPANSV